MLYLSVKTIHIVAVVFLSYSFW